MLHGLFKAHTSALLHGVSLLVSMVLTRYCRHVFYLRWQLSVRRLGSVALQFGDPVR